MSNLNDNIDLFLPDNTYTIEECKSVNKIGVGMIVRNEGKLLEQSLERLRGLVDEVMILDTGSEDCSLKTIDDMTYNLFYLSEYKTYPTVDFARMRNDLLLLCIKRGWDWALMLDADEELEEGAMRNLRGVVDGLAFNKYVPMALKITNLIDKDKSTEHYFARFIPLKKGIFKYVGIVHEQLYQFSNHSGNWKWHHPDNIMVRGAGIKHYGYSNEIMDSKGKWERNISLLLRELECKDRRNGIKVNINFTLYNILTHYYTKKDYDKAYEYFKEFFKTIPSMDKMYIQTGFCLGMATLFYLKKHDEMIALKKFCAENTKGALHLEMYYMASVAKYLIGDKEGAKEELGYYDKLREAIKFTTATRDMTLETKVELLRKDLWNNE